MTDKIKEQPVVSVIPDQALVLERETVKGAPNPNQVQLLKEIAQIAETRKEDWLYDPGFKQLPF